MKASKINNRQEDIFKERLGSSLNPRHELIKLSGLISWGILEAEFACLYKSDPRFGGKPPKPIRLMVGILLLQHMHNLSNEQVVRMWVENPYWQFFCGYDFLQWKFPIDSSSLTRFRKRLGPERMERIFSLTVLAWFVVSSLALPSTHYNGHTLGQILKSVERLTHVKIKRAFVDRGYKGHGITDELAQNNPAVFISGQRKGVTKSIRKQLKRRSAIEPTIGHMKQEGKLG